jgi:hypothetical protein
VKVLQDCIRAAGSIEGGLKSYVGAANIEDDGGYTVKVMAEHAKLQAVARGRQVQVLTRQNSPSAATSTTNVKASVPEIPAVTSDKATTVALK